MLPLCQNLFAALCHHREAYSREDSLYTFLILSPSAYQAVFLAVDCLPLSVSELFCFSYHSLEHTEKRWTESQLDMLSYA